MTDYTASAIHIASDAEIIDRWDWAKVGHWCQVYGCHPEWLARAMEACRRAGREPEYIERRYLQDRREEPHDPLVDAAMREVQAEERRRSFYVGQREWPGNV